MRIVVGDKAKERRCVFAGIRRWPEWLHLLYVIELQSTIAFEILEEQTGAEQVHHNARDQVQVAEVPQGQDRDDEE